MEQIYFMKRDGKLNFPKPQDPFQALLFFLIRVKFEYKENMNKELKSFSEDLNKELKKFEVSIQISCLKGNHYLIQIKSLKDG